MNFSPSDLDKGAKNHKIAKFKKKNEQEKINFTNIIQINIKSIKAHKNELETFLGEMKTDFALLQETNLNSSEEFSISKYEFISKPRKNKKGGGVGILVHKSYAYEKIKIKKVSPIEIIGIKTKIKNLEYHIFSIYIPPKSQQVTLKKVSESFSKIIENLQKHERIIIGGDFNSHHTSWGSEKIDWFGRTINDLTVESEMVNLNEIFLYKNKEKASFFNEPRQVKSVIDLTLISPNVLNQICDFEITDENLGSDHMCVKITLNETKLDEKTVIKEKIDLEKYEKEMKNLNVKEIADLEHFEIKHAEIIDNCKIFKKININKNLYPKNFWSKEINELKNEKRLLFKIFNRKRKNNMATVSDFLEIKKVQAKIKREVRKNKRKNFKSFVEKLHPENSIKTIYKNFNKLKNKGNFTNVNFIEDKKENALNFLKKNFTNEKIKANFIVHSTEENIYNSDFSVSEIEK